MLEYNNEKLALSEKLAFNIYLSTSVVKLLIPLMSQPCHDEGCITCTVMHNRAKLNEAMSQAVPRWMGHREEF